MKHVKMKKKLIPHPWLHQPRARLAIIKALILLDSVPKYVELLMKRHTLDANILKPHPTLRAKKRKVQCS